ncbi:MAG: redoxin family protein [Verrucomicrobiota bacterium]
MRRAVLTCFILTLTTSGQELWSDDSVADKAEVFIFVATDCPIANGYAPELARIHQDYAELGICFTLVYPEPSLEENEIKAHLKDYSLPHGFVHDRLHKIVQKAGATVTPEVAVFNAGGILVYRGKIDNRYSEYGDRRNSATETYLRDVLKLLSSGKAVEFHETEPIGCFIEAIPAN